MRRSVTPLISIYMILSAPIASLADETGTAVVSILAEPPIGAGTFLFSGTPAGELRVQLEPATLSATELAAGGYSSTLEQLDPAAIAVGYELTDIRCDDPASSGDVAGGQANFQIAPGKTVNCVFVLIAPGDCICPKEGSWQVNNLPGEMVCTGSFSMTMPLTPSKGAGTFKIEDNCDTIIASGLSEDEATLVMHRDSSCGYQGTVGGSQDGIPMTIEFNWSVLSDEEIEGQLHSLVSQQGMTCTMSRDFELDFAN
jgi:hypothetical protein